MISKANHISNDHPTNAAAVHGQCRRRREGMVARLLRHPTRHDSRYPRGMAPRSDPERIFQAWRTAIRNNLTRSGMSVETAERWCDAWELEAAGSELPRNSAYWEAGQEWIAAQRAARRPGW